MALLPLRLFLGITFVYAGVQKLSDPGFLHPGAPTYIGTQLHGFANGTPGGFLLRAFALPDPKLAGIGVAIVEIVVGLLVTLGLLTRIAAAVGLGLNFILFLTNSWHAYPYFLGSDIVFVFAWLPLVLAGAQGQPALDNGLVRPAGAGEGHSSLTRRELLGRSLGAVGVASLAIAGIASAAKGSYKGTRTLAARPRPRARSAAHAHPHRASTPVPSGAVRVGPSRALSPGQAATYTDPADGQPDIAVRLPDGKLKAYSAVCTHAGCTVGFSGGTIACPCHGATYDPNTGNVTGGPAPQGLSPKHVVESGGQIYAVPS
jgi:thiosulfate dehydrogenase [quinone] large subunit